MLISTNKELPLEYKDFKDLFKEKEGKAALPKYKLQDYKILFKEGGALIYYKGLIPLLKKEEDFLKEYIKKYLEKKFIQLLNLPITHGVFFILKKDRTLQPYIDY